MLKEEADIAVVVLIEDGVEEVALHPIDLEVGAVPVLSSAAVVRSLGQEDQLSFVEEEEPSRLDPSAVVVSLEAVHVGP